MNENESRKTKRQTVNTKVHSTIAYNKILYNVQLHNSALSKKIKKKLWMKNKHLAKGDFCIQ